MQPAYISLNASDVMARQAESASIQKKIDEFLEHGNKITIIEASAKQKVEKIQPFNRGVATFPDRHAAVETQNEAIEVAIRDLSQVEIMGVQIKRTAAEVAVILKRRGYKLEAG